MEQYEINRSGELARQVVKTCGEWQDIYNNAPDEADVWPLLDRIDEACSDRRLIDVVTIAYTPAELARLGITSTDTS